MKLVTFDPNNTVYRLYVVNDPMVICPISMNLWVSYGRLVSEAGVKLSSHAFRGLGKLLSCHSWSPSQLSDNGKENQSDWKCVRGNLREICLLLEHPALTLVSPCSPPQLSCVLPGGGWWDVRGCCLGGHVIRLLLPAGQPGGHHGRQPSGPEWPCTPAASCGEISKTLRSFWVKVQQSCRSVYPQLSHLVNSVRALYIKLYQVCFNGCLWCLCVCVCVSVCVCVYSWHAIIVDGHSVEELCKALSQPRHQPTAIIAKTIKGKGIPGNSLSAAVCSSSTNAPLSL